MQEQQYDLVVVGAGPGGYVAAIRAAQLGLNTACVEVESALGGTCLRIGCIPSKALLESSAKFLEAREKLTGFGVECEGVKLNLPAMMQRKTQAVTMLTKGIEALFKKNKITRYAGRGQLAGPGQVLVESSNGAIMLKAKHVILATGSKPASLPGITLDGDRIGTSTEALSYSEVPAHLVVIGAGYIGLELGSVWRRLGAKVTVVEFLDRILFGMDNEIAAEAKKIFEKQGLSFRLGAKVASAKVEGQQCIVSCETGDPLVCDRVLMAVGRKPNTEKLGLESVGISLDKRGCIPVNSAYATSAAGFYAIGDVIPGPMLAHKAEEEGVACVEQIVNGHGHVNYDAIPGVAYTDPEIGSVGKTEEQLRAAGVDFKKGVFPFRANGRARTVGHLDGFAKVLADAKTDRLLGVHIIGAHAGDLINEAAAAIAFAASSEDLARACHAHPTLGEALKEAAMAADGRAIHF